MKTRFLSMLLATALLAALAACSNPTAPDDSGTGQPQLRAASWRTLPLMTPPSNLTSPWDCSGQMPLSPRQFW